MSIHETHAAWLRDRGLDPVLAEALGLETVRKHGAAWLRVPYIEDGKPVNAKYRLTREKRHMMEPDSPLTLMNVDCLKSPEVLAGAPVVVTEGEWDLLAAMQAGHKFVVSVPNGAPSDVTEDLDGAARYDWVDRHADLLSKVKTFILATDNDQAGLYLRQDLIGLFGADRCRFVEYTDSCKDLNDVLQWAGVEGVTECLSSAKECPVKGLYKLSDFPEQGEIRSFPTGVSPIEHLIKIVPGTVTFLTGWPGMGKSTLLDAIIAYQIEHHFPVCLASFETMVKPIMERDLLASLVGCAPEMLRHHPDTDEYRKILEERLHIIAQVTEEEEEMTLEEFLDTAAAAVRRGARMIILDPWNELDHKKARGESETDYVGRAIRAIKRFARQHNVPFWVVAHPSKPDSRSGSRAPGLHDISGSSNFANKADYGLTYHRPKATDNKAKIICTKVKKGLPGKKGDIEVGLDLDHMKFHKWEQYS